MPSLDQSQLMLLGLIFIAAFGAVLGVMLVFTPSRTRSWVEQFTNKHAPDGGGTAGGNGGTPEANPWTERLVQLATPVSKLSLPKEGWEHSQLRVRFMNAGWRSSSAPTLYFATKTALAIGLPVLALGVLSSHPFVQDRYSVLAVLALVGAVGYYLPNSVLSRKVEQRQLAVFEEFPDALDLLTVCVEAGLGLDAALMRVADELALRCPVLADELQLMMLELRSGFSKEKALTNLSLRTGVEDVDKFASTLIQADRFGTSLADSLRVQSDMLRTKRRMRAEEQAAKIALKLLFPLLFLIFPTLMLVLLGPAVIQIYRVLLPTMAGQ